MDDLGRPVAYLALSDGVPVYDRDARHVGTVEHVLADEGADIFHGLLIRSAEPERYLFADRDQLGALYERGVALAVSGANLHEPTEDTVAAGSAEDAAGERAREGLRRAWDWLSRPR
jgi:PRC-barrel domain